MKDQTTSEIDTYLSFFVSAYRKSYNTQRTIIHMLKDWKEKLD